MKKYYHNPVRKHCFNVVGSDKLLGIEMCIVNNVASKTELHHLNKLSTQVFIHIIDKHTDN